MEGDGTVSGGAGTDTIRFTGDIGANVVESTLVNTRVSTVEAIDVRGLSEDQRTVTLTDAALAAQGTSTFTITDGQYDATATTGGLDIDASTLTAANSIDATFNNRSVALVTISTGAGATTDTLTFAVGGTTYAAYTALSATETADTSAANLVTAINAVAAGTYIATTDATGVVAVTMANPGAAFPTNATLTSAGSFRLTVGGVANAAAGASTLPIVAMDNSYTGGAGADTFRVGNVGGGLTSADTLAGGTGTDTLFVTGGTAAAPTVVDMTAVSAIENITTVGTGAVTINAFHASTSLAATATLTVNAASQTNSLLGLSLNASNSGTAGKLVVTGGAGADTILGGAGADTINGGAGNDTITAGAGNDSLTGGDGDDDFVYASETAFSDDTGTTTTMDTVAGGAGNDILQFTTAASTISAAQLANVTGVEIIDLAVTASSVTLTDAVVDANGGDVQQVRALGAATVTASALTAPNSIAVRVQGTTGTVSVTGGAGADSVTFSGNTTGLLDATDAVKLGSGTDTIFITNVDGHTAGTGAASTATLSTLVTGVESIVISDLATDQSSGDVTIDLGTFTASSIIVDGSQLDFGEELTVTNTTNSSIATSPAARMSVTGGAGNDTLTGGAAAIADTLIGGGGNDQLTGGAGIDSLSGGAGNDTFVIATLAHFVGLTSAETVLGGDETDTLSLTATGTINASDLAAINSIEIISLGGAGANSVVLADTVFAANGATTLSIVDADATNGVGVNATVLTATNSVTVTTANGTGDETITGGAGTDTANVALYATGPAGDLDSSDSIDFGAGSDTLSLVIRGNISVDLAGVANVETISSRIGTTAITGGAGATTDSLTIAAIPTTLITSGSTLTMNFSDRTGAGSVIMNATNSETDKFIINSGAGADTLYGGSGADSIDGAAGNDTISGGSGADTLFGNAGDDTLVGGAGIDALTGGTGSDIFKYTAVSESSGASVDAIADFTSADDQIEIALDYSAITSAVIVNATVLTAQAGLTDSQGALSGERGQAVYDTTNSRLYVNLNADNLITSLDYSVGVNAASTASGTIAASDIDFRITGTTAGDTIASTDGNDIIVGNGGNDSITSAGGADTITTTGGADTISSGAGIDTISAGAGADVITGGTGADQITGGLGSDIFAYSVGDSDRVVVAGNDNDTGSDKINDFASGDLIRITVTSADTTWDMAHVLVGTATGGVSAIGAVGGYLATTYLVQAGVPATSTDAYDIAIIATSDGTAAAFANAAAAQAATVVNLTGTAAADTLTTGANADTITGGGGADNITGGDGADTINLAAAGAIETVFLAISAADTINGFAVAEDLINLEVLGAGNIAGETAIAANAASTDLTTAFIGVFANGADGTGTTAITDYTDLSQVVAFLAGSLTEDGGEVYVAVINDLLTQKAYVYNVVVNAVTTVANTIEVGDVALVGIVNISTAAALTTANTTFTA
jgi:Ca2+-binding RTX toxin-like protein